MLPIEKTNNYRWSEHIRSSRS